MRHSSKQVALKIIDQMPENASLEEIMYTLFFRKRVDRGLSELDRSKTVTHEGVRRSVARWLRSTGR